MTAFTQLKQADGTLVEFSPAPSAPAKRPSRWSPANWPVSRKVLAIVLVPLILAATFGGLRIYASASAAGDLRLAADRAELIPGIDDYMAAMEGVLIAATEGGDGQAAMSTFNDRKLDLQQRLEATEVAEDVGQAVGSLLTKGPELVEAVMSNSIDLRQRILNYGPLLLTGKLPSPVRCTATSSRFSLRSRRWPGRSARAARWPSSRCWSLPVVPSRNPCCAPR